jgi:redox-sensitive bicupin YhaK (pirin superfamily)
VIDLSELWRCTVEKRRREELERLEAFGQIVRVPDGREGEAFSWCLDHGGTFLVDWRHGAGLTFAFRDVRTVVLFGHGVLGTHTLHAQTRAEEVRLALMETYPSIMIQAVRYYSTYEKNQYVLEFGDDMQVTAAKLALGGMEAGR